VTRSSSIILRIYRRDLLAAAACANGLAVYDAIAAMALARGDERATKRLRLRWTPLHALWLASAYPSDARWLVEEGIVPAVAMYGAPLDGASLDGASLDGASLRNASLDGASLRNASLRNAFLDGASLRNASLDGASLRNASLDGASLDGASLRNASLVGASLVDASLRNAFLDGAYWSKSRPAPDGWTHDPPRADRDWVVLRRAEPAAKAAE